MAQLTPVDSAEIVRAGRVSGVHGVRGWLKVFSDTAPREAIFDYRGWYLFNGAGWHAFDVAATRRHGQGLIARLTGIDDRDAALAWLDADIGIARAQLPALNPGEYYWVDLIGLAVVTTQGKTLGVVESLLETGANDVLVVRDHDEILIPYVPGPIVQSVDLGAGRILVEWHERS